MSDLVEKLRKAADWGEDEFDVLSPQDAAAAIDHIEALERELAEAKAELASRPQWAGGRSPVTCSSGGVGFRDAAIRTGEATYERLEHDRA
jgi:hypothetical protein